MSINDIYVYNKLLKKNIMGCGCKQKNQNPPPPPPQPAQPAPQTSQSQNRSSLQESVKKTILKYYKVNKSGN